MNLTNQQRIEILELTIKTTSSKPLDSGGWYICTAIEMAHMGEISFDYDVFDYFPELLEFKPAHLSRDASWFGDGWIPKNIKKRRTVLKKLLEVIKNKES